MKIPATRRSLTIALAVMAGVGVLALPGVASATSAARPASRPHHTTQAWTGTMKVHGVRAPSIRDLPTLKPGAAPRAVAAPDPQFAGTKDPNPPSGIRPRHVVNVPAPTRTVVGTRLRPAAPAAAGINSAFPGMTEVAHVPADPSAAPGPLNIMEATNDGVAVYQTSGGNPIKGPVSLNTWFGVPNGDNLFDPHVVYDQTGNRFITIAEDQNANTWEVSVTNSPDGTAARCNFHIGALSTGETEVDFPLVGVSPSYLMLSIREGTAATGFNTNRLFVLPLASIESFPCNGSFSGWFFAGVQNPGGGTADTLVPVTDYNTADTNINYLINSYGAGGSSVSLYKFTGNGGTPGVLQGANVPTPAYSVADPADQKLGAPGAPSVFVDTGNSAITQAVNNTAGLYATLTSGADNVNTAGVLWMKFDPNAQTLENDGVLINTSLGFSYFNPSITVGADGSTMYTYALSGASIFPSAAVVGMDANNNLTTDEYVAQGQFPTPQTGTMTCSPAKLPCSRWGDFTATYNDVLTANFYWGASMYMTNANQWGTTIASGSAS